MNNNIKRLLYISMLPIMLCVGYLYAQTNNSNFYLQKVSDNNYSNLINNKIFEEVKENLDTKFYPWNASNTAPTESEIIYGIIKGYVSSYNDPFTQFFTPEEAKTFHQNVVGEFGGIGAHMELKDGLVTVVAPLKDSPAYKNGIKSGDIVISVNDEDVVNKHLDYVVSKIRGDIGKEVKIKMYRPDIKDYKEFVITREKVKTPTIDTKIIKDVFVIQFYSFTPESPELFRKALIEYLKSGKRKLLIDLRNNPGGYLESAIAIASYFLESNTLVLSEKSSNITKNKDHFSFGIKAIDKKNTDKVYVLVDGGSASASEILAGAIQDYNVGTIIGMKTFGKGSVQELVNLSDGSSIKITIASWFTPKGNNISLNGIKPDIVLKRDSKTTLESELNNVVDMMK